MKPILNDKYIEPTPDVLKDAMGDTYANYLSLLEIVSKYGITPQWQYYNDGKSWLCKMLHKKKNIFWFSVWADCFKTTFYFTDKAYLYTAWAEIGSWGRVESNGLIGVDSGKALWVDTPVDEIKPYKLWL